MEQTRQPRYDHAADFAQDCAIEAAQLEQILRNWAAGSRDPTHLAQYEKAGHRLARFLDYHTFEPAHQVARANVVAIAMELKIPLGEKHYEGAPVVLRNFGSQSLTH